MSFYWGTQNALQHEALCLLSPLLRIICRFLMFASNFVMCFERSVLEIQTI